MTKQNEVPKEAQAYLGTWNNPQNHCEELQDFDYTTATPEQFRLLQEFIINKFVHASNRAKNEDTSSIVVACELGENGTFHIHMLFCALSKTSFEVLQRLYPSIHLDRCKGNYDENLDYLYKRGTAKNEAKADTKLCEPIRWGTYTYTPKDEKPKVSIFTTIGAMLDEGKTPSDIYAIGPAFSFYANAIERCYAARKDAEIPSYIERTVFYHVGAAGSGKTHVFLDLEEKYGRGNVYKTPVGWSNIWSHYAYQSCVVMDELRSHCLRYSELLGYLDNYKQFQMPFSQYKNYAQLVDEAKKQDQTAGSTDMSYQALDYFRDNDVAATPKPVTSPIVVEPKPTPTETETTSCRALEVRDKAQYKNWLTDSFIVQHLEPQPEEFEHNPFIQYNFGSGSYISTEFDCLAFLETMN